MPAKSLDDVISEAWTHSRLRPRDSGGKAVTRRSAKLPVDVDDLAEQLAAVELTTQAGKGSSGKRRTFKIGDTVLKEDEVEEFQDNIELAKEVLETKTMVNLDDLDDARISLDKLSNKKKALSNFFNKNSNYHKYQIVSFSALKAEHLVDMGVTLSTFSQNHSEQILKVFNTFSLDPNSASRVAAAFDPFWFELVGDGRYLNNFKILKNSIGKKPEARARILTDYILTQLIVFVHKLGLVQLMFVELLLSSSSNPVPIDHGKTATLLTGTVDYAIMSSVNPRPSLAKALGVHLHDVEEKIREKSADNSLEGIMESSIWPILKSFQNFQFTIIEEKRKDLGAKELKDCIPQVTGEALALQWKTRQKNVLWCLSNGEKWIFGVLNKRESRSFPSVVISDNDLEGSIKLILKMLILWTVCPVEKLKFK